MPNEVIVQKCHRFGYDFALKAMGCKFVCLVIVSSLIRHPLPTRDRITDSGCASSKTPAPGYSMLSMLTFTISGL